MNLVTGKVRFSYIKVFEPGVTPNGDMKYSATLLIPKSDTATYQSIMNEINKTVQEAIQNTFGGVKPLNLIMPVYDGDGLRDSGEPFGAECKGHWVLSAKSNTAPEIVDAQVQPIISKNEFYSGCYGRASIKFYAYNKNGKKGIGCGLGNVQKLEDGQPLDGRTTAKDDFTACTAVQNNAPMTYTQPMQYQQPQYQQPQYQQQQQPIMQQGYQVDPITGQPIINNVYGVN